jgi:hypothetical protein
MKLHPSMIEKLVEVYTVNSGWSGESKLKEALSKVDFTVYTQQDGTEILVDTEQYHKALTQIRAENMPNAYTGR